MAYSGLRGVLPFLATFTIFGISRSVLTYSVFGAVYICSFFS